MGCTLILSEKREAAERIARALDDKGAPRKLSEHGVPYFEAMLKDRQILQDNDSCLIDFEGKICNH